MSAGTYTCGFKSGSAVSPGLRVDGFGLVSLPLPEEQGKRLQQLCQPSPFAKGQATVWDPLVRKTGQVDAAQSQMLESW